MHMFMAALFINNSPTGENPNFYEQVYRCTVLTAEYYSATELTNLVLMMNLKIIKLE